MTNLDSAFHQESQLHCSFATLCGVIDGSVVEVHDTELLEVTITHNLSDISEVAELFSRRLIALEWGRKGPDLTLYTGRAHTDVALFHTMREDGAAVIAAYKGVTRYRSDRLIGLLRPGVEFRRVNGLLCLPLSHARVIDSSANFLGNLPPRQCTVQPCGNRAKGRLSALVLGQVSPRSIWSLHNRDVETLVANYLVASGLCSSVWSGSRAFEDIDHAGYTRNGQELLAQTTVSTKLVSNKAAKLLRMALPNRTLHFFGPAEAEHQCPEPIEFHAIEAIFNELDQTNAGHWLIDRMLNSDGSSSEETVSRQNFE